MTPYERAITIKCPVCGKRLIVDLSKVKLNTSKEPITLTIVHGDPPHTILVYLNKKGEVISIQTVKQTVVLAQKIEEPVLIQVLSIEEINQLFGTDALAYVLTAIKKGEPVYFMSGKKYDWALEIATSIALNFKLDVDVRVNEIGKKRGFYVITEDFYSEHRGEIEKNLILSTIGGLFGKIPKMDKKVLKAIKDKLKTQRKVVNDELKDLFI